MLVFIGCSSYNEIDKKYFESARMVANICSSKGYDLIMGASNNGLMGEVFREYKKSNNKITLTCAKCYIDDFNSMDHDNKILVDNTFDQLELFTKSDYMIYLPGGYGTFNEIFYLINGYVTHEHNSKLIIINNDHYYDEVKLILEKIKREKFAKVFDFVTIVENIEELNNLL